MSAGDLAEPIRRPERAAARTSTPTSPWLRLVPSVPVDAARAPFIAFVIGLLAVGLIGLLLLNTSLQKRAFEVASLQSSTAALADQQGELEQRAGRSRGAPGRRLPGSRAGDGPQRQPGLPAARRREGPGQAGPGDEADADRVSKAEKQAVEAAKAAKTKSAEAAKSAQAAQSRHHEEAARGAERCVNGRIRVRPVTPPNERERRRRSNAAPRPRRPVAGTESRKRASHTRAAKPTTTRRGTATSATRSGAPTPARVRRSRAPLAFKLGSQTRRLRASFLIVAFVMSIFAGRLIQLQGIDANAYATQARDARIRTVVLPATRGDITDTNGVELATTVDTVAITADPKQTAPSAAQIAGIIAPRLGLDATTVVAALSTPNKRFVYVARQVDQSVWKKIRADLAIAHLVGVSTEADPKRVYPAGSTASAIVGFVGNDTSGLTGRAGLEDSLNSVLAGKNGQQTYEASSEGPALPLGDGSLQQPVAGQGIQLTIDADLQYMAQKVMADAVKQTGADSGDAIVMDVKHRPHPRDGNRSDLRREPRLEGRPGAAQRSADDRQLRAGFSVQAVHGVCAARQGARHARDQGTGAGIPLP